MTCVRALKAVQNYAWNCCAGRACLRNLGFCATAALETAALQAAALEGSSLKLSNFLKD